MTFKMIANLEYGTTAKLLLADEPETRSVSLYVNQKLKNSIHFSSKEKYDEFANSMTEDKAKRVMKEMLYDYKTIINI